MGITIKINERFWSNDIPLISISYKTNEQDFSGWRINLYNDSTIKCFQFKKSLSLLEALAYSRAISSLVNLAFLLDENLKETLSQKDFETKVINLITEHIELENIK